AEVRPGVPELGLALHEASHRPRPRTQAPASPARLGDRRDVVDRSRSHGRSARRLRARTRPATTPAATTGLTFWPQAAAGDLCCEPTVRPEQPAAESPGSGRTHEPPPAPESARCDQNTRSSESCDLLAATDSRDQDRCAGPAARTGRACVRTGN